MPWLRRGIEKALEGRELPTSYLLEVMDSEISDERFGEIADELNRRAEEEFLAGWGFPDHSRA